MRLLIGSIIVGLVSVGCGKESPSGSDYWASTEEKARIEAFSPARTEQQASAAPDGAAGEARTDPARKIIYVAEVDLVVTDFSAVEGKIAPLVERFGGYLADVRIDRTQGESRSGRWVARVPVDQFEGFIGELADLGVPTKRHQTAQDVTAEYTDLEARIANTQRLEERLLELLKDRSGKLSEIIEVEQQLARVREEIETMQGQLRYMANRAELATVTIVAHEDDRYVPAQAPTFTARLFDAWSDSLGALRRFAEGALIVAVSVVPWLVLLVPLAVWYALRRRLRASSGVQGS